MKPYPGAETARLLADLAGQGPARPETPEEQLQRLSADPLALYGAFNLKRVQPGPVASSLVAAEGGIAGVLVPVAERARPIVDASPRPVLKTLKATAPVRATIVPPEEGRAVPFEPSMADRMEALVHGKGHGAILFLGSAVVVATILAFWLIAI